MDHNTAASTHATERYLLGDMLPDERETFEEHLLACRICGDDMQLTTMFVENAKAVFRERSFERLPEPKSSWRSWFELRIAVPAFAALLLAAVVGYQSVVIIPGLQTPRVLPAAMILDGATRAALPQVPDRQGLRFQMAVDLPVAIQKLRVELTGETGGPIWSQTIDSPGLNQPLDVYFPGKLKPGRYSIVIRAAQSAAAEPGLITNRFEVIKQGE